MTDNSNKLQGWHFVAGARCPSCNALDVVKFHFGNLQMLCVDCDFQLDADGIAELTSNPPTSDIGGASKNNDIQKITINEIK